MFQSKDYYTEADRLTIDKINDEGCLNLLEMFLSQLAEDYHFILEDFVHHPSDKNVRNNFKKMRRFILSNYFAALTGIEGRDIIGTLDGKYGPALEVYEWARVS